LLFNSVLEYSIRRVQVNQGGLKLNGTYQLLVYADDVNMLGGRVHNIRKNTENLVVASKEIGLEVHAEKTKYWIVSLKQRVGENHSMKLGNKFSERLE
jgi:hypothetical protein